MGCLGRPASRPGRRRATQAATRSASQERRDRRMTTTTHTIAVPRSSTMNELLLRALAQERIREQDDRQRAEYVRRLVVLRRRQRRVDRARRALATMAV